MSGVSSLLRNLSERLFSPAREALRLELGVVSEHAVLRSVRDVHRVASGALPFPGVISSAAQGEDVRDSDGAISEVRLCRLRDAYLALEFGAVITGSGGVLRATFAEAASAGHGLASLPDVATDGAAQFLALPSDLPKIDKASVFLPWGGRGNYAHFLLEALSGLAVLSQAELLREFPPICPPLADWQREAVKLLLGDQAGLVREVEPPLLGAGEVVFATTMDHFLNRPSWPLRRVRDRILQRVPEEPGSARRLYLSQACSEQLSIEAEDALALALETRGFTTVDPAAMSVSEQAALFRDAELVVGATGAALANCLFGAPGARVFEIRTSVTGSDWVARLCGFVGLQWRGFDALPLPAGALPGLPARQGWRAPIEQLVAAVDAL